MKVAVTGGAGFIGGVVCRILRERGDDVVALVREPARAIALSALGCTLVTSDLSSRDALAGELRGVDAVLHVAGSYRIGIPASQRPRMWDANVGATERVLDAATDTGVPRTVYVSTVNTFGDTHGAVVDESYVRDPTAGFLSYYDETKFRAHEAAQRRIGDGAPVIVVMPGGVYGPGDHSEAGSVIRAAQAGRLRVLALGDAGLSWTHVDDLAAGIVAAMDAGQPGRSYILAGPPHRLREAVAIAAALGGHKPPRFEAPLWLLRATAPFGGLLSRVSRTPPNLHEVIAAGDGVTYWATASRAQAELGFHARDLETGLRDTFGPAAAAPAAHA